MTTPDDAKARAAKTYNMASDRFDDPANSFWARYDATGEEPTYSDCAVFYGPRASMPDPRGPLPFS